MDEVLEDTPSVKWEDIAGQEVCSFLTSKKQSDMSDTFQKL